MLCDTSGIAAGKVIGITCGKGGGNVSDVSCEVEFNIEAGVMNSVIVGMKVYVAEPMSEENAGADIIPGGNPEGFNVAGV